MIDKNSLMLFQVDESSGITTRLTLSSIKNFIRLLLESNHGRIALSLLDDLCTLVSAKYWLVKLELCNIIGDIPFLAVYHLTGKSHVQVFFSDYNIILIVIRLLRIKQPSKSNLTESNNFSPGHFSQSPVAFHRRPGRASEGGRRQDPFGDGSQPLLPHRQHRRGCFLPTYCCFLQEN